MTGDTVRRLLGRGIATLLIALATGSAAAQIPDEFTNLELLPDDIGRDELISIMRDFSTALGVRCKFCHVGEDPNSLEGYDFASDEPGHKRVARGMMRMTDQINSKLLPAAGLRSPMRVRCVTCHHGVKEPHGMDEILLSTFDEEGIEATVARYRELHGEYYGSGAYDFGPMLLNEVAETLAREMHDVAAALALTELNAEMNSDSAMPHLMLGQLYGASGEPDKARASLERAVELEPGNAHAKQMLERLSRKE